MARRIPLLLAFAGAFAFFASPTNAADSMKNDQDFVTQAAHLARAQASHAGVRSFGETMVTDHTRAGKDLETIAKAESLEMAQELQAKLR